MDLDRARRKFRERFVNSKSNPNNGRSNRSSAGNIGFTTGNIGPNFSKAIGWMQPNQVKPN